MPSARPARPSCASSCSTARRSPRAATDFERCGLRGSKAYASAHAQRGRRDDPARLHRREGHPLPARGQLGHRAVGPAARAGRRVGVERVFPDDDRADDHRRPHAVPRARHPGDRPHRLRLPDSRHAADTPDKRVASAASTRWARRSPSSCAACARARSDVGLHSEAMTSTVEKLLLAAPRGYCAGVDRAVQTVERALELHGAPVYVRKEIVHNKHVVEQAARARRDLRRRARRHDPRGRRHRLLRPRRLAGRPRRGRPPRAADDRRDLPARHQGPPRGGQVRRRGLHDRPHRPRRPRGGRGHDGRGARAHRPRRDRGGRRRASRSPIPTASPTSRRPRCRSTRPARSSPGCASGSRTSPGRAPTTSVTPRRTARRPSSRWPRSATSCSSSARRTRRTRSASSRSRASTAPTPT